MADARQEPVAALSFRMPVFAPHLARRLRYEVTGQERIDTLIDYQLQLQLERLASQWLGRLPAPQSLAIMVMENQNLAVRAYVGSIDFNNQPRDGQVDMANAIRSPGSTLKPFIYGMALDQGLIHSQSLLVDAPRLGDQYQPENFTRGFAGPVSVQTALRNSLNVPAVQVLEALDPQVFFDQLAHTRVRLQLNGKANLSIALGGLGTNLESLIQLYGSLARGGLVAEPRFRPDDPIRDRYLMSEGAAWIIRDILRHPLPGYEYVNRVNGSRPIAWKTGTSYGYRDAWAVAVTDHYTLGVWIGRPDGSSSPGQFGAETAVPLLAQVIERLPRQAPLQQAKPESVSAQMICWPLGMAEHRYQKHLDQCHKILEAWTLDRQTPPTLPDPVFQQDQLLKPLLVNADNGLRVDRSCQVAQTEQLSVAVWPLSLEPWLPPQWRRQRLLPATDPACPYSAVIASQGVLIRYPQHQSKLASPPDKAVAPSIEFQTLGGEGKLTWFLNGQVIAQQPSGVAIPWHFEQPGDYQLAVVDQAGHSALSQFQVLPW